MHPVHKFNYEHEEHLIKHFVQMTVVVKTLFIVVVILVINWPIGHPSNLFKHEPLFNIPF